MKKYLIENAECGITEGGIACGPVAGNVVITVQFREEDKSQWLTMVEVDGIPTTYLFDKDVHDRLVNEEFDDTEFSNYVEEHYIDDFNGIVLSDNYTDTFSSFADDPQNPAIPLIRYLIALMRCDRDEETDLISMAKGKYVDELNIPLSDLEEEYYEELVDEEE